MMTGQDENIQDVLDALSAVAPTAADAPRAPSIALAQLKERAEPGTQKSLFGRFTLMNNRKYALATLTVLVVMLVAFSFPGVRAAASNLLGLFRVQKFAAISVSPEQLALLEEIGRSGVVPGEIEMIDEPEEPHRVDSLEAAESALGWEALSPDSLSAPDDVYLLDGGQGHLTINVESARAFLSAAGADPSLVPDSLDGADVNVTIYAGVSQNWADGIVLMQAPSPLVEYPEDVDAVAIGEALLQALGVEPSRARRLARSIDWTNTLLLPVPENMASFNEVSVNGEAGLALGSVDGSHAGILWESGGTVFALSGSDVAALVDIANSIGR
jgi:hypothetical protein